MAGKKDKITPDTPPEFVEPDDNTSHAPQEETWWNDFKKTVEDPKASVYDFLRDSAREMLELEDGEGFVDILSKAQRKAIAEALSLTKPKELRDALKNLEQNRLFFDVRGRTILKLTRLVMDSYIVALHGETKQAGLDESEASAIHQKVEELIEEQLENKDVLRKVEDLAGELTHVERQEIKDTVEEAAKQLREKSTLSRIADDAMALGKTFFKPDTLTGLAIGALPIITWKYRWMLALGLGAFASRKAVYHAGGGLFSMATGDVADAKKRGVQALQALKAAGGNVISVGLTPAFARLPRALTSFGPMAANYVYDRFLDVSHWVLQKKEGDKVSLRKASREAVKAFFKDNENSLLVAGAKALKIKVPHKLTAQFEKASKRINFPGVRRAAKEGVYVGGLLLKRSFNRVADYGYPKMQKASSALGQVFRLSAVPEQDNNNPAESVVKDKSIAAMPAGGVGTEGEKEEKVAVSAVPKP